MTSKPMRGKMTNWQERFDERYLRLCDYIGDKDYKDVHNDIKSFIQAELNKQKREIVRIIKSFRQKEIDTGYVIDDIIKKVGGK
jgi:hypothetical protein